MVCGTMVIRPLLIWMLVENYVAFNAFAQDYRNVGGIASNIIGQIARNEAIRNELLVNMVNDLARPIVLRRRVERFGNFPADVDSSPNLVDPMGIIASIASRRLNYLLGEPKIFASRRHFLEPLMDGNIIGTFGNMFGNDVKNAANRERMERDEYYRVKLQNEFTAMLNDPGELAKLRQQAAGSPQYVNQVVRRMMNQFVNPLAESTNLYHATGRENRVLPIDEVATKFVAGLNSMENENFKLNENLIRPGGIAEPPKNFGLYRRFYWEPIFDGKVISAIGNMFGPDIKDEANRERIERQKDYEKKLLEKYTGMLNDPKQLAVLQMEAAKSPKFINQTVRRANAPFSYRLTRRLSLPGGSYERMNMRRAFLNSQPLPYIPPLDSDNQIHAPSRRSSQQFADDPNLPIDEVINFKVVGNMFQLPVPSKPIR